MSTVAERVALGVAVLDEEDRGWWRADADQAIDLDQLAMWDGDYCVLGQRCPREFRTGLASNYMRYAPVLSGLSADPEVEAWGARHGFDAGPDGGYDALTAEWCRVIRERRDAA